MYHLAAGIEAQVEGLLVVLQQIVEAQIGVHCLDLAPGLDILVGHKLLGVDVLQVPVKGLAAQLLAQHNPVRHIANVWMELQIRSIQEKYVDVLVHPD